MAEVLERASDLLDATPMMQQYLEVKRNYEGYILLYRLGDFYECFFEDAILASRELELTLTGRDCGQGRRAAMCGVPFHKSDVYVGRLVEKGYKVAICEQVEDPATAEGLVRREVVRVVTPGTVTDASLLVDQKNNFLCAICYTPTAIGLGFADVSTGEFSVTHLSGGDLLLRLKNELATYQPNEVILNTSASAQSEVCAYLREAFATYITADREKLFEESGAADLCLAVFGEEECRKFNDPSEKRAVAALLGYIRETQMCAASFARELSVYSDGQYMEIDTATRRNLELVESMRTKEKKGSLLWVLDKTKTAMGARLLRGYILRPLLNPAEILLRQSAVKDLTLDLQSREEMRELLSKMLDMERLTAKAVYGSASGKDLRAICQSALILPEIYEYLPRFSSVRLREIYDSIDLLSDLTDLLSSALVDDPPFSVREGGIIRDGYHPDVDYLRSIHDKGKEWIRSIEEQERDATGIKNLRVSYNKVFGYYIEVTKSQVSLVPDRYIRKQTLTNCERYITEELKEMESTILGASDKLCALEYELFTELREKVSEASQRIQASATMAAEIDVYLSLADVAVKNRYACPEIDLSTDIDIKDGRHPVVERFVSDSYFVPNDTYLNTASDRLALITGPNMAGKSTYMRQVTLIAIMAQIGSFVPAKEARIGIVDKVFTRVGASDDLASGQSTFMLEMNEVAHILKNATKKSLIVYDEVGRGTTTYDGMSIARATAEYTLKKIGAKTLFATHYHEMTSMEEEFQGVVNYNIAAKKRGDSIVFLRKILRGGTDDSYGIEVAKLAGVPNEVIKRAREILSEIESEAPVVRVAKSEKSDGFDMMSMLRETDESRVADKIRGIDINTLTPIEAMNFIFEMKKLLH